MRAVTDLPLAVGFGISKPEQVAELGRQVEAVAVGSAIVHLIERGILDNLNGALNDTLTKPALELQLEAFIRQLKGGFGAHA